MIKKYDDWLNESRDPNEVDLSIAFVKKLSSLMTEVGIPNSLEFPSKSWSLDTAVICWARTEDDLKSKRYKFKLEVGYGTVPEEPCYRLTKAPNSLATFSEEERSSTMMEILSKVVEKLRKLEPGIDTKPLSTLLTGKKYGL